MRFLGFPQLRFSLSLCAPVMSCSSANGIASNLSEPLEKTDNVPRREIILRQDGLRQNGASRSSNPCVGLLLPGPLFHGPVSRARPDPGPPPHPEGRLLPVRHQV